jgi:hypothetical protein
MKQVYLCEKCGSTWVEENLARECEGSHKEIRSVTPLKWCPYPNKPFPLTILVKLEGMGELDWDYATYRLERIGPKGV